MPTKIYTSTETLITFSSGKIGFAAQNTPDGSGYMSEPKDFGSGSRFILHKWRATTALASGVPVGSGSVEIYMTTYDDLSGGGAPLYSDGNLGSGEKSLSTPAVRNALHWIGSIDVTDSADEAPLSTSGLIYLPARFNSVVYWNYSGSDLSSTSTDHVFQIWPIGDEIAN